MKTWMEERFQLILQPDGNMSQVLGQFAKFSAEVCKGGDQAFLGTHIAFKCLNVLQPETV